MLSVTVNQSADEIARVVLIDMAEHINRVLRNIFNIVRERTLSKISELILESPEVMALVSGDLGKELGVVNPEPIVNDIIARIQAAANFAIEPATVFGGRIVGGGYIVEVLRNDFTEVMSVPDSTYVTKNNVTIPWLDWLLFAGNSPLIYGWKVVLNPNNPSQSRTGGAIMVKNESGVWSVPSQYAGTQTDNFLTRALAGLEDEINNIISAELQKRI